MNNTLADGSSDRKTWFEVLKALVQIKNCPDEIVKLSWQHWFSLLQEEQDENSSKNKILDECDELLYIISQSSKGCTNTYIFELMEESRVFPKNIDEGPILHPSYTHLANFVAYGASPEVIEYLLSKGADPYKFRSGQNSNNSAVSQSHNNTRTNLTPILTNYKTIRENNELKQNQVTLQNKLDQVLDFLQNMNIATPTNGAKLASIIENQPDLPHNKKFRGATRSPMDP